MAMACQSSQDAVSPQSLSLSDLPDEIIHHIFSFMGHRYMSKVFTLSKRFYQLCFTTPYLYFSCNSLMQCRCDNFIRSFHRHLEQRGDSKLQKVKVFWFCYCGNHSCLLGELLTIFLEHNVEEVILVLHISHPTYGHETLFTSLFQSQHLKVLRIYFDTVLSLQPLKLNSCLQELTLYLRVVTNSVAECISNSCPFLKFLSIHQTVRHRGISDRLIIRSSSLENLEMITIFQKHVEVTTKKLRSLFVDNTHQYYEKYVNVEINAPDLQNLIWLGGPLKLRTTDGLKKLETDTTDGIEYMRTNNYGRSLVCIKPPLTRKSEQNQL